MIVTPNYFGTDGRLRGVFVYMLLCRDDGPIYAKVGISANPEKRFQEIRTGCPLQPRQLFIMEQPSRQNARRIEKALHGALRPWHATGEWFATTLREKSAFNAALKAALRPHDSDAWPCRWDRIDARGLLEKWATSRAAAFRRYRRHGPAYQDFTKDSR